MDYFLGQFANWLPTILLCIIVLVAVDALVRIANAMERIATATEDGVYDDDDDDDYREDDVEDEPTPTSGKGKRSRIPDLENVTIPPPISSRFPFRSGIQN